jgi:hypothetical protein
MKPWPFLSQRKAMGTNEAARGEALGTMNSVVPWCVWHFPGANAIAAPKEARAKGRPPTGEGDSNQEKDFLYAESRRSQTRRHLTQPAPLCSRAPAFFCVAFVSRGVADTIWKSLEIKQNICRNLRHGQDTAASKNCLILLT